MRLFKDLYVYPWTTFEENNCNTIFIDGGLPTLIDPGHSHLFHHLVEAMAKDGKSIADVRMVLCTHSHPDHIEAIDRFDDKVVKGIGREEYRFLYNGGKELYIATGCQLPKSVFKIFLKNGIIRIGEKTFRVFVTPGHSPGSISLFWEEERVLISGDTVFYMGVGRVDLPGGDPGWLEKSIRMLAGIHAEYLITGHGQLLRGEEGIKMNFKLIMDEFVSIFKEEAL